MVTQAVHIRDKFDVKGCRKSDNTIPEPPEEGCLGNPFFLKNVNDDVERAKVIEQYREYFYEKLKDTKFKEYVLSLKGKRIACFCKPKPCHVDIIVDWIENHATSS